MIRFLKRHVWPWAEIERLKCERDGWRDDAKFHAITVQKLWESSCEMHSRLAKYERPRDENGRFTSNG